MFNDAIKHGTCVIHMCVPFGGRSVLTGSLSSLMFSEMEGGGGGGVHALEVLQHYLTPSLSWFTREGNLLSSTLSHRRLPPLLPSINTTSLSNGAQHTIVSWWPGSRPRWDERNCASDVFILPRNSSLFIFRIIINHPCQQRLSYSKTLIIDKKACL